MASEEEKRKALLEKYQLLRSVTHSNAPNKASILVDATKYIKELKQKVESLHQEAGSSQKSPNETTLLPANVRVTVGTHKNGFLIHVLSDKGGCPGLLVSILEVFEELGLEVLEAKASSSQCFQLEAVGQENEESVEGIDAQMVKQAVCQAVSKWSETT